MKTFYLCLFLPLLAWGETAIPVEKTPKITDPTPMGVTPEDLNTAPSPVPAEGSTSEAFPKTLQTKKHEVKTKPAKPKSR